MTSSQKLDWSWLCSPCDVALNRCNTKILSKSCSTSSFLIIILIFTLCLTFLFLRTLNDVNKLNPITWCHNNNSSISKFYYSTMKLQQQKGLCETKEDSNVQYKTLESLIIIFQFKNVRIEQRRKHRYINSYPTYVIFGV